MGLLCVFLVVCLWFILVVFAYLVALFAVWVIVGLFTCCLVVCFNFDCFVGVVTLVSGKFVTSCTCLSVLDLSFLTYCVC